MPSRKLDGRGKSVGAPKVTGLVLLAMGLVFLARHDTESGHLRILGALMALAVVGMVFHGRGLHWTPRRLRWSVASAWAVPIAAVVAAVLPASASPKTHCIAAAVIEHCRFGETPITDVERLAVWCREHTPQDTTFIGPPGPKTFRLWSRRAVAFNRAASPYHARGLADWAERFRQHVGFRGTNTEFARAYLADRQALEHRYQEMSDAERADLARRQGATHVLASATSPRETGPLELLHVEGRYAVYRVREAAVSQKVDSPQRHEEHRGFTKQSLFFASNFLPFVPLW